MGNKYDYNIQIQFKNQFKMENIQSNIVKYVFLTSVKATRFKINQNTKKVFLDGAVCAGDLI